MPKIWDEGSDMQVDSLPSLFVLMKEDFHTQMP